MYHTGATASASTTAPSIAVSMAMTIPSAPASARSDAAADVDRLAIADTKLTALQAEVRALTVQSMLTSARLATTALTLVDGK